MFLRLQRVSSFSHSFKPLACANTRVLHRTLSKDSKGRVEEKKEESKQDAISLLKADHRKVEGLFEKYKAIEKGDASKQDIALAICKELIVHTQIEEEIFYPACKGKLSEDMLSEVYVEHDGAKTLISEIIQGGKNDEYYDAKVKVLAEQVDHHVKEEERDVFAQAKKAGLDMDVLGARMKARKEELMSQLKDKSLPKPQPATLKHVSL